MAKSQKIQLNESELAILRKLLSPNMQDKLAGLGYSQETIKSVMSGRRYNEQILLDAVRIAKDELIQVQKSMKGIVLKAVYANLPKS